MKNFVVGAAIVLLAVLFLPDFFTDYDARIFMAAIGDNGKAYSVIEQRYKVWPSTQQVVAFSGGDALGLNRLTKCTVWDAKHWSCEDSSGSSVILMDGRLRIFPSETLIPNSILAREYQVSRWDWWRYQFGQPVMAADGTPIYYQSGVAANSTSN